MRNLRPVPIGLALIALLGSTPVAVGQDSLNPRPAPKWILNALQLTQATVQDLQIPATRQVFRFQVDLGGRLFTVELEPNDIRTPDFQLLVDDGTTIERVPTPPSVTWIGHVVGMPESRVAATVVDRKLDAVISLDAHDHEVWGVESVAEMDLSHPITEHVVYTTSHADVPDTSCGTDHSNWHPIGQPGLDMTMKIAEIAIDCDLEYYQRNGSNVTTTQNTVTQIVNGFDAIYRRDCEIQYLVTTIIVRTSRTYTNTDMRALLPEFRSRWNSQHGNIRRDLAHLFTGKGSFSGIVGIAYLGVVCNIPNAYAANKAFSSLGTNVGLVAHEAGHNWNAPHCDSSSPCNIMCSGLGGCNRNLSSFAPVSINTIVAFKNSRTCLDNAISRPAITGINPSSTPVLPRALITLTGTNFTGVTTVNIGSQQVAPRSVDPTSVTFLPDPPSSLGTFPVSVTNSAGTSNSVNLTFTQVSPGFYSVSNVSFAGGMIGVTQAGDPNDNWFILTAFNDNTTLPFLGFNVLTSAVILAGGSLDGIGTSETTYQVPANISLSGIVMYSQTVQVEETSPAFNWISNVLPTNFLF